MANGSKILIGAIIGGVVGYIVGDMLAYHFAPEYYTEEELLDEETKLAAEYDPNDPPQFRHVNLELGKLEKGEKEEVRKILVNYAGMSNGGEKPEIASLVEKYNDPEFEEEFDDDEEEYDDFDDGEEEYDEALDLLDRMITPDSEDAIHILSEEEFRENASGFRQVVLNYYAGDDVLTDEKDIPLENVEKVVGEALLTFGLINDDPDVIYVCNPALGGEYKIHRYEETYQSAVLGVKDIQPKTKVAHNVFEDAAEEKQKEDAEGS